MDTAAIVIGAVTGVANVAIAIYSVSKIREIGAPENLFPTLRNAVFGTDSLGANVPSSPSAGATSFKGSQNDPKFLIAYVQYFVALVGSVLSIGASVDPSGILEIYGFGYWYSLVLLIMCLAFGFITFWVFSWIQFLLEFNKFNRDKVARFRRIGFNALILATVVIDLTTSYFVVTAKSNKEACVIGNLVFLSYWAFTVSVFTAVISILTWRTLKMLKESTYHKSNSQDVQRITRRTYVLNCLTFTIIFLTVFGMALRAWKVICGDPSEYYWFMLICAATTPMTWTLILLFNHVLLSNKIELAEFRHAHRTSRTSDQPDEPNKIESPTAGIKTLGETIPGSTKTASP